MYWGGGGGGGGGSRPDLTTAASLWVGLLSAGGSDEWGGRGGHRIKLNQRITSLVGGGGWGGGTDWLAISIYYWNFKFNVIDWDLKDIVPRNTY